MTKILIEINSYKEFCRNCHFFDFVNSGEWYCRSFRKFLSHNTDGSFSRLPECLAAEKKAELITLFEEETRNLSSDSLGDDRPLTNEDADNILEANTKKEDKEISND